LTDFLAATGRIGCSIDFDLRPHGRRSAGLILSLRPRVAEGSAGLLTSCGNFGRADARPKTSCGLLTAPITVLRPKWPHSAPKINPAPWGEIRVQMAGGMPHVFLLGIYQCVALLAACRTFSCWEYVCVQHFPPQGPHPPQPRL